jgi:uncharacterized protein (TIRG00374 family)
MTSRGSHGFGGLRDGMSRTRAFHGARRITDAAFVEAGRALSRREVVALALIVLIPTLVMAYVLLPELTARTPSVNDDSAHFVFIRQASNALNAGQNLTDHWDSQFETGVPQFLFYQHLPALAVVALQRVSFGMLDLLGAFNLVRYVLMVGFPLTVLVAMRTFGFSGAAAALAAAASTLLSGNFRYGFEYESYTFMGFGVFTQLWAMHLSILTVAAAYVALQGGRRLWVAAGLFGVLILTHLLYAYMVAIAIGVIGIWGISRSNLLARFAHLTVIGGFALAISSYMWLPLIQQTAFLNITPYLQAEKYDSFGAGPILGWLVSGDLIDHGRLPVLTGLLALGIVGAIISRSRAALVILTVFVVALVLYFGRPTLGTLIDYLPLGGSLLLHRFIGGVDIAIVLLIGVGGAVVWRVFRPERSIWRLAAACVAIALLLAPAVMERITLHQLNASFIERTANAVDNDLDAKAIVAKLETLPAGRVYAGLPATYGKDMAFGDVYFYNLLAFDGVEALAPPNESFSLTSDYIWDFDDADPADYDMWNVRYVIAPADRQMASFLTPIVRTQRYALYQASTTGYAEYVAVAARRPAGSQSALFDSNLAWERGTQPGQRQYIRYDYPDTSSFFNSEGVGPGCPTGGQTDYERFQPGQIDLVVECPAAATLILKTTYHPNWEVRVDHTVVPTFMVSPSYIGISMPPGKHTVDAVYQATPIKLPLQILGLTALMFLLLARGRLDLRPGWATFTNARRKGLVLVGGLVSAASLLLIARAVDLEEAARILASAQVLPVVAALGVFVAGLLARVLIWRLLLPSHLDGTRVTARALTPVLMVGYLGNSLLPARLGEVLRGYLISRREGVPIGGAFGSIALERMIDVATLACLGLAAAVGAGANGWVLQWTAVLAGIGVLVIVALATVGLRPLLRLFSWLFGRGPLRLIVRRFSERLERFVHWSGGSHRRRAIIFAVGLSTVAWLSAAAANLLVARALGLSVTPAGAGLITAVSVLVTAIPSAPAYVGTFELAVVAVAQTLGIPAAPALAFAALSHVITLIPTIVGGPLSLAWMGIDLRSVAAEAREDRAIGGTVTTP